MNPNVFSEPRLGFRITKPQDWDFVPVDWAKRGITRTSQRDASLSAVTKQQQGLFFFCQFTHNDPHYIYPALQARFIANSRQIPLRYFLQRTTNALRDKIDGLVIHRETTDAILAGRSAGWLLLEFDVMNGFGKKVRCESSSWIVPHHSGHLTITLSRPLEGPYQWVGRKAAMLQRLRLS